MLLVSCAGQPQAAATLSPSVHSPSPPPAAESPSPSPSLPAVQRGEPSLPMALEEAAAAAAGGRLYVMGGFDAAGNSLRNVWVFDGSAGPHLPLGLDHTSAATVDDHVYVAGGHSFGRDSPRLFRLDGSSWTELSSMRHARGGHALLAAAGALFAIGGNTASANVAPAEVYDPQANTWTDLPSLPAPRNHVSGFVFGANVCVAGGRAPAPTRGDRFHHQSSTLGRVPHLPRPTSGAGGAALARRSAAILGGEGAQETSPNDPFA